MTIRRFSLLILLPLLAAAAPAVRSDHDPEPPSSSTRHASPRAVFDAYVLSSEKKDFRLAMSCLTRDAQQDLAAFTAYLMVYVRKTLPEDAKKPFQPVFDVMDKHGLTEKATEDVSTADFTPLNMKLPEKARQSLRKLIKKPGPFMKDLAVAQEKAEKNGLNGGVVQEKPKTTLEDLKINGNKATGTIVSSTGGFKMKQKVEFVKSQAGWKMIPALEYETDLSAPPPPPKPVEKK